MPGGWQYLALTVDSGAAEAVVPQETGALRSGLNWASATGDPIPNVGEQKVPLLTSTVGSRTRLCEADAQLWTPGGL